MSAFKKGTAVAVVQVLLVTLVAAKLMIDRTRYPQVWVETAPYDPNDPLRGRYVQLLAVVEPAGRFDDELYQERGRVEVRGERLVAIPDKDGPAYFIKASCRDEECLALAEPLAFFIPEDIADPSIRDEGEELWARVTVPPRGAPRPIRLGVKEDGRLTPLRF